MLPGQAQNPSVDHPWTVLISARFRHLVVMPPTRIPPCPGTKESPEIKVQVRPSGVQRVDSWGLIELLMSLPVAEFPGDLSRSMGVVTGHSSTHELPSAEELGGLPSNKFQFQRIWRVRTRLPFCSRFFLLSQSGCRTWLQWTQGPIPSTLTAVGVVRRTTWGPFHLGSNTFDWCRFTQSQSPGPILCEGRALSFWPSCISRINFQTWLCTLLNAIRVCWICPKVGVGRHFFLKVGHTGGGLSYRISKGVRFNLYGMLHTRKSVKGRRVTQSPPVSIANFVKVSFRVRFIFSTCPELWGLYSQCNFHFVPRAWASPCTIWLTKAGPLSEPIVTGSPCLGTISSEIFLATTVAVSPLVGKASTHPEKVSTRTNR